MPSLVRRTLLTPFWLAQVLTQEKFFARNPVIGSRWLNEHGLHTARAAAQVLYPDVARLQLLAPGDGVEPLALATEAAAMDWMDQERPNLVAAALRARDQEMPQYAWRLADSLRG